MYIYTYIHICNSVCIFSPLTLDYSPVFCMCVLPVCLCSAPPICEGIVFN